MATKSCCTHHLNRQCLPNAVCMFILIIGMLRDVGVVTNAYNGDVLPIPEEFEYAALDCLLCIIAAACYVASKYCVHAMSSLSLFAIVMLHCQWYVHSPFREWPDDWIADKPANDVRHRVEFYMCHSFAFTLRCVMLHACTLTCQHKHRTNQVENVSAVTSPQ